MKKFLLIVGGVVVLAVAGLAIAVLTFDLDAHRDQITEVLQKQTGRTVTLGGPLKLSLSTSGVVLGIQDASIGNPPWASRKAMAGIGKFKLGLDLLPLLSHELVITSLSIENADILLESKGDQHNWDMGAVSKPDGQHPVTAQASSGGPAISIKVDKLSIKDSQVAMRTDNGPVTVFKTDSLTLGTETGGLGIHFKGEYNGQPLSLDVKTSAADLTSTAMRPIDVELVYAALTVKAKGQASLGDKKAAFDSYSVSAGKSALTGKLSAAWGGARPSVSGTLQSDHLAPADFKMPGADTQSASGETPPAAGGPERLFSDAPLSLAGLKAADANMTFSVAEFPLGAATVKQISGTLALTNGHLTISPFKAELGSGTLSGQINLDAGASPAHMGLTVKGGGINIADMLEMWGMQAFLTGRIDTDMNIVANGNSLHQFASTTSGSFNLIGSGGDVVSSAANKMSAGLDALLTGGQGGNEAVNCMVARFTAANGNVKDNGMLVDTAAATVAGSGGFDLRSETISMDIRANPKGVNVGGMIPPLHVGGSFLHPAYSVSAAEIAQNVVGMLMNGGKPTGESGVPTLTAAQGQNACLASINHPTASAAAGGGIAQQLSGKATDKINAVGGQMLKGLFGK